MAGIPVCSDSVETVAGRGTTVATDVPLHNTRASPMIMLVIKILLGFTRFSCNDCPTYTANPQDFRYRLRRADNEDYYVACTTAETGNGAQRAPQERMKQIHGL